jgi:hypothetical protein
MIDRYDVQAAADAQILPRILNFFAQRDVLPTKVIASARGPVLNVVVEVPAMDSARRELIAARMRQIVLVNDVQCATQPTRN